MLGNDSIHRLAIEGEFTIFTAQELKDRFLAALEQEREIEVDLSQVSEMDSAGLQLMIGAKREATRQGKPLRFSGHSPAVVQILDLCGVSGYFGDPVLISKH